MTRQLAKLRGRITQLWRSKSGNAMLLTAMGMPALIAATGYGIDTAQWYAWKRELQHSADQAALGGAWARSYSATADYSARAMQEFNGNQAVTSAFAATPVVQLANYNGGTNNSVLVNVTATRQLPFSGYLFNRAATIAVTAQAAFAPGGTYSACLVSLKPDGSTFTVGGSATVIANCGLGALSCDNDAIKIDGSASVTTTSIVTCGTASVPAALENKVTEGATTLTDAYAGWTVPDPKASTPNRTKSKYCVGNGKNAIAALLPGTYIGGFAASCNTTFASGVYFFDGGTLDLSTNAAVVGTNVLFVLRNGAQIKLGGQGGQGSLSLSPMTEQQLLLTPYAADAARLSKMLVMQDGSTTNPVEMVVNGNTNVTMSGILYLPKGDVKINGGAASASKLCFQISSWTLDIRGSAYLETLCDTNQTTSLGSSVPKVNLVA